MSTRKLTQEQLAQVEPDPLEKDWGPKLEVYKRENEREDMSPGGTDPFKPIREHGDGLGDAVSEATATTPTGDSLTRQEFADDADVNKLLKRYGIDTPVRAFQQAQFTEIDYNVDLQQALGAIQEAKRAHGAVPEELKEKYPTWKHVLDAVETGEYQKDLDALAEKKKNDKKAADRNEKREAIVEAEELRRDIEAERAAQAVRTAPPAPEKRPNV